jgi:MFS family permease
MNVFKLRRVRRLGGLLAGLGALVTMLVVTGTAALAMVDPGGGDVLQPPPPLAPAASGMPGWQITLIAVGAALVAAVLAVLADRARSARRRPAVASAAGNVPAQVSKVR